MAFRGTMSTRIADWKKLFFVKIGAMRKKHTLLAFSEDSMAFLDVKSRNVEHVFSGTELDKIKLSKDQTQFVVYIKKKKTTVISPHRPEILNEIYTLMTQGVDAVFPGSRIRANGEVGSFSCGTALSLSFPSELCYCTVCLCGFWHTICHLLAFALPPNFSVLFFLLLRHGGGFSPPLHDGLWSPPFSHLMHRTLTVLHNDTIPWGKLSPLCPLLGAVFASSALECTSGCCRGHHHQT